MTSVHDQLWWLLCDTFLSAKEYISQGAITWEGVLAVCEYGVDQNYINAYPRLAGLVGPNLYVWTACD